IIAGISFGMFQLPLLPLQLLFLNLLSDVFPALALGIGKGTPHIMKLPPKDPAEPIITKHQWYITGIYGFIIAIVIGGVYVYSYYARDYSQEICNTITFFSLAFAQLLHVFDMREANEPVFLNQVTRNKYVWFALILCFAVLFVAYNIPLLKTTLSFQQLDATMWIIVSVASILPILLIQAVKHIFKL
ncbi:MAG: cation transporting ATPase C-terminal domain-containing protein, partial [Bacteroidota bacterium]